jgi:hypothetical protein
MVELPPGSSVADLFQRLAVEVDPLFGELTDDDSGLFGVNLLVLNGEQLRFPRDTHSLLPSRTELHLIPPISGG